MQLNNLQVKHSEEEQRHLLNPSSSKVYVIINYPLSIFHNLQTVSVPL